MSRLRLFTRGWAELPYRSGLYLAALLLLAPIASAQEEATGPSADTINVSGRLYAVGQSLDEVATAAEAGLWQAADEAFNQSVDLLDVARTEIEPSLGAGAAAVFVRAYGLLDTLDLALRSEDAARVGATVAQIKLALGALSISALAGGPAGDTSVVMAWQERLADIQAHADAGRWIPMRNAALELYEAVVAEGPDVAAATADAPDVAMVRTFAARGFIAALDQDLVAGARAVAYARSAIQRLLVALGAARPTAAPLARADQPQFRAYQVEAAVGDAINLPVVAENLPRIGLGAFELEVRWSVKTLRLTELVWEFGRGESERDDTAGRLVLRQPQAPTGPSERTILATLGFVLVDGAFDPEDFLPQGQADRLRLAFADARTALRRGDLAAVGRQLELVYSVVAPSAEAGMPGSVGDSWQGVVSTEVLLTELLAMIEQVSEPSLRSEAVVQSDVLLERMDGAEAAFDAALAAYGQAVDGDPRPSVPILLHVLNVTDTTGADIGPGVGVPGQVLITGGLPAVPAPSPAAVISTTSAPGPVPTLAPASSAQPARATPFVEPSPAVRPSPTGRGSTRSLAALVLLAVVFGLALGGAYLSQRSAKSEPDRPSDPP